MPIETNLYLCLFLLCASGALSAPLRRARIHPAAAGFVCLGAMFFSVFEEVQLLPRLYAGAGGCFLVNRLIETPAFQLCLPLPKPYEL